LGHGRRWRVGEGSRRRGDDRVSGYPPSFPLRLPPLSHALRSVKVGGGGASSTTR
jgi:hypothetical protein